MSFTQCFCCLVVLGTIRNTSALNLLEDTDNVLEHDDYYAADVERTTKKADTVLITGLSLKGGKITIGFLAVTGALSAPIAGVAVGTAAVINDVANAKSTLTNGKVAFEEGNYACGSSSVASGVLATGGAILLGSAIVVLSGGAALPLVAGAAAAAGTSAGVVTAGAGIAMGLAGAANQLASSSWCTNYQKIYDDCRKEGKKDDVCLAEMKTTLLSDAKDGKLDGN